MSFVDDHGQLIFPVADDQPAPRYDDYVISLMARDSRPSPEQLQLETNTATHWLMYRVDDRDLWSDVRHGLDTPASTSTSSVSDSPQLDAEDKRTRRVQRVKDKAQAEAHLAFQVQRRVNKATLSSHEEIDLEKALSYPVNDELHDCSNVAAAEKNIPKFVKYTYTLLAIRHITEPKIFHEATTCKNTPRWNGAVGGEYKSLMDNETWILGKLTRERKSLKNRWVYTIKFKSDGELDRFKAQLVIKGFLQRFGIEYSEIFSPIVRIEVLRLLLILAAAMD